jgi:hypothetical protein
MTGFDTGLAGLVSRIDTLLEGVAGAGAGRAGTAQTGASTLSVDTPNSTSSTSPIPNTPVASAQAVLSEVALTLDAISRFGGEATPPVLGEEPIWPSPPAIDTTATEANQADAENSASTAQGSSSTSGAATTDTSGPSSVNATATATTAAALPVEALAAALEQTVAETGLFYESHLAQWLSGTYSLEDLAEEPQTQLAAQALQTPDESGAGLAEGGPGLGASLGVDDLAAWLLGNSGASTALLAHGGDPQQLATALASQLRAGADPGAAQTLARESTGGAAANTLLGAANGRGGSTQSDAPNSIAASIHEATIPLVRQQLDLLATQQFRWSGQVWPGAKLDWTIEPEPEWRRGPRGGDAEFVEDDTAWHTRVTLALPTLGTVDASLVLKGTQLIVRVQASPGGAARIATGGDAFARRLSAAGIELASLSIREIGGAAPAPAGVTPAAGTSAYARAAAEAAETEAQDVWDTKPTAKAAPANEKQSASAASSKRTGSAASPLDHLFDDPFEWTGL